MTQNPVATVTEFLENLPDDRRGVVSAVRKMVRASLPKGYQETVRTGMLNYEVPLERYPKTYNKMPLNYVAVAAQKGYYAIYLNCFQASAEREGRLRAAFEKAGKKLDMGKACIRFKTLDAVDLEAIGREIAATPVDEFITQYEESKHRKS